MGWIEYHKPVIVMLVLQFTYAGVSLSAKASFLEGMSPRVFVVYRQAFGTLFIAPIAYFSRSKTARCSMGWKSFSLIFIASLIGVTGNQMIQYEGIYLASSSAASALSNLIPAITFVAASIVGYEPIDIRSLRTIAKILGTIVCVTGASAMTLIKGPKLLNFQLPLSNSLLLHSTESENLWLVGCLCLFVGCCCWSFWLIIQVPVTRNYPDHLSLSAWMCLLGTLQSATITLFTDPYLEAWELSSYLQLGTCLYSGIVGSGISIFVQAWVIERRGPVFSAMFNPLNTVIVTIIASIVIGAFGIIIGLYIVLWGKAKDVEQLKEEHEKLTMISQNDQNRIVQIMVDGSSEYPYQLKLLSCKEGALEFMLSIDRLSELFSLLPLLTLQAMFQHDIEVGEGIYLASSSAASALSNLIPAITFVAASIVGFEPVNIRSLRSIAKILGTVVFVTSASAMTLIKDPKLVVYVSLPAVMLVILANYTESTYPICYLVFLLYISWYQEPKFLIKMPPRRNRNINDVYYRITARMEERLDQFVDQFVNRMNDMMNPKRREDRNGRRSEGEESEYLFFEGDGSSDEWGDYGVTGNGYEGPPVFDDDQYEEEIVSGDVGKGFVDNYLNFQEDENNVSFSGVVLGVEEESMPVYDTDIEDVIDGEEDNMEDVVVVANDLCSSKIQTTVSVNFSKTVDSNPQELILLKKGNFVEVSILIGKKYQEEYLKAAPMDDKLGFKTIKVRGCVIIMKGNLM
ncbi:nodulin MtN21 /EamA-like transporter family protein [Tanacetum coccineum]